MGSFLTLIFMGRGHSIIEIIISYIFILTPLFAMAEGPVDDKCRAVMDKGEFLFRNFGIEVNVDSLLADFHEVDLSDVEVQKYLKGGEAMKFVNFYFMLRDMKRGAAFDEARDGISITPLYPLKSLNRYDFAKLMEIFTSAAIPENVKEDYMKKLPFLFRTFGYPEELAPLKSIIENNVSDSKVKQDVLAVFNRYDSLRVGRLAPAIVTDDGVDVLTMPEFKDKVVVVDVWASWCHSCLKKMPAFKSLAKAVEGRFSGKVCFVALSVDSDSEAWKKAETKFGINELPSFIVDKDSFVEAYIVEGVPRYIIIDKYRCLSDAFAPSAGDEMMNIIIKALK